MMSGLTTARIEIDPQHLDIWEEFQEEWPIKTEVYRAYLDFEIHKVKVEHAQTFTSDWSEVETGQSSEDEERKALEERIHRR